jgi:hypothetical protein
MLPATTERVALNTRASANDDSTRHARKDLAEVREGGDAIERRLEELDREWDFERVFETQAALGSLVGLTLGATVDRRFFVIPAIIGAFLFQHALQGWCPPLPFLRRLGVRTQSEIERERYALKAIRGDFAEVPACSGRDAAPVQRALEAVHL